MYNEEYNLEGATLVHKVLKAKDDIAHAFAINEKIKHYFLNADGILDLSEINGAEDEPQLIVKYYRELYGELRAADAGYTKSGIYKKGFNIPTTIKEELPEGIIIVPGNDDRHGALLKKFSKTSFAIIYDSGYYLMACKDEEEFVFVFALLQCFIEDTFDVQF